MKANCMDAMLALCACALMPTQDASWSEQRVVVCSHHSTDYLWNPSAPHDQGGASERLEHDSIHDLYDPVNLERLRQTVHGEADTMYCQEKVRIGSGMLVCQSNDAPMIVQSYHLSLLSERLLVQKHICDHYHQSARIPSRTISLLVIEWYESSADALLTLINNQLIPWADVEQINLDIDVCDVKLGMSSDLSQARELALLQQTFDLYGFKGFHSSSQPDPRGRSPSELLVAAGFPENICRYKVAMIRVGGEFATGTLHSDTVQESNCKGSVSEDCDESWGNAVVMGQMHSCSEAGTLILNVSGESLPLLKWRRGFPRRNAVRAPLRSGHALAALCGEACTRQSECRSFTWLDESIARSQRSRACDEPRRGLCVGCSDSSWSPFRHKGAATGAIAAQSAMNRWESGGRAFFLQGEPKGGWTLTDMPGFVHTTDAQMLDWLYHNDPGFERGDAMGQRGAGDLSARPGSVALEGCANVPRAAVIYLVGTREEDLEALALSLACLDRYFLRPNRFCYPVFFFRESWDDESMSTIVRFTNARTEFHIADMSFPRGFEPDGRNSQQSKRSKWGYQHMSRFWIRTVLEHPSIANLDWYLRLDTDSRFTTPVLDLFVDAQARGLTYGYRIAGKDWIGKNKGLWSFHAGFVKGLAEDGSKTVPTSNLLNMVLAGEVGDGTEAPIFYTNFELVSVTRFRSPDMWRYIVAVDDSHGCYVHNWGDAQVRWLQVNTFLPTASVHRYCHFGYVHASAETKAFQCFQEPWVGIDCPAPWCDLRGRHPGRLLNMDSALIAFGPAVRPDAFQSNCEATSHSCDGSLTLSTPACWTVDGELGDAVQYHAFWLGSPSSGVHGRWEVEASRGELRQSDGEDGSLVIPFTRAPVDGRKPVVLVVELRGLAQGGCNRSFPVMTSKSGLGEHFASEQECGCGAEGIFIVLPAREDGSSKVVADFPSLSPRSECACEADDEAQSSSETASPPENEMRSHRSCSQWLQRWYDLIRYALLSEEYVSRYLRESQGNDGVKQLPPSVETLLARTDVMNVPYRVRMVALHWIVLVILAQDRALQGLEELLARFNPKAGAVGHCHPVWQRPAPCFSEGGRS